MKLNHLMVYMVPPVSGLADMAARGGRPRAIFSFTGAVGAFDVYGENVLLYGSDRTYVRESSTTPGTYETYRQENSPFFQSTLGIKYSASYSSGLSYAFHVQGYYNGTGYADSTILQNTKAIAAIKALTTYQESDYKVAGAGMWYLAGSASVSGRFGEGRNLTQVSGSVYALTSFSDGSVRFNPQFEVQVGDQGGRATFTLSDLTAIGAAGSEYAPKGNKTTPAR
ncbi:MAG: hypothetical protein SAMD01599839_02290 [Rectinema sp.]